MIITNKSTITVDIEVPYGRESESTAVEERERDRGWMRKRRQVRIVRTSTRGALGGLSGLKGAYDDDGGWDEEWYDKLSLALLVVSIRWWVSSVPILEPVE